MKPDQRPTVTRHPVLLVVPLHHTTSRMLQAVRASGFETRILDTVPDVMAAVRTGTLAAMVLDVALTGLDPATLLKELRSVAPQLPVIALTSREQREQTVSLLRSTQDDYLTTPFPVEELVSRLRLRIQTRLPADRTVLRVGVITIDTALRLVSIAGQLITLSPTEYAMLVALAGDPGLPVSQSHLATAVWGQPRSSNLVEVYIGYLRRKLGADRIRTVRGAGYVLEG
ncbi:MAG TPA: response regulator transcription factor [Pseudonocardiaceae bacterium]|jgi:two-component system response regulator QseB